MCQEGNVWFKTGDRLTSYRRSFFQQPHPTQDFQIVQTPYPEAVLQKVAELKILDKDICPQSGIKTYFHDSKMSKTVVIINTNFLMQTFPLEIGIWSFCLQSYFNALFTSSNDFTRTKVLTALKLQ